VQDVLRWTASQVRPEYLETLRGWPATLAIDVSAIGAVLFCHGTPCSETETFTRLTAEDSLLPVFQGSGSSLVVCGHTHMQFDRMVGRTRVVNAGSVGAPFGRPGADWLLLSDDVQLQHTSYDLAGAAGRVRATRYPQADEFARRSIMEPPSEDEMARVFANVSFRNEHA
jgi:diadenosine tetraphosphatase ApaH/serine/threonine PP2A family protein phosphatase